MVHKVVGHNNPLALYMLLRVALNLIIPAAADEFLLEN